MADNYLERKMEEHLAPSSKKIIKNPSLDSLLIKNRSYRKFSGAVSSDALEKIASVTCKIASAKNRQVLRYAIVESGPKAELLEASRGFGKAFIIICSTLPEMDNYAWIDLGIAAQSMLLKATELGYNGIMCANFDKELASSILNLEQRRDNITGAPLVPVLLIALGVKDQKIQLLNLNPKEHREVMLPYAKEGINYVPKIHISDLVFKA